jgi:hypothetical protein
VTHQDCVEIVGIAIRVRSVNGQRDAVGKDRHQDQVLERSSVTTVKEKRMVHLIVFFLFLIEQTEQPPIAQVQIEIERHQIEPMTKRNILTV